MERLQAFRELKGLVTEAVDELGERRVALMTGSDPCSVAAWLRRPSCRINAITIRRVIPRLRTWQDWLWGYELATEEIRHLEATGLQWEALISELRTRIDTASEAMSPTQLMYFCEVPRNRILQWQCGLFEEQHRAEMLRALGHLRYLDECLSLLEGYADHHVADGPHATVEALHCSDRVLQTR